MSTLQLIQFLFLYLWASKRALLCNKLWFRGEVFFLACLLREQHFLNTFFQTIWPWLFRLRYFLGISLLHILCITGCSWNTSFQNDQVIYRFLLILVYWFPGIFSSSTRIFWLFICTKAVTFSFIFQTRQTHQTD